MGEHQDVGGQSDDGSRRVLDYLGRRPAQEWEVLAPNPVAKASWICGVVALLAPFCGMAVGSLVEAACGHVFGMIVGIALLVLGPGLAIAAVVLGIVGVKRAKTPGVGGAGQATFGISLGLLEIALVILAIYAMVMMNRIYGQGGTANRVRCASNLEQIGQACLLYARDYNGLFPPAVDPDLENLGPHPLACPGSDDVVATGANDERIAIDFKLPGHFSYIYVGAGRKQADGISVILAYDKRGNHAKKGMNVLYADGTVQWVEGKEVDWMVKDLERGTNPPRPMPTK